VQKLEKSTPGEASSAKVLMLDIEEEGLNVGTSIHLQSISQPAKKFILNQTSNFSLRRN
jgi:hypothetical protein